MKHLFLFLAVIICKAAIGQNCNCLDNFEYVTKKIQDNYIGYRYKVVDSNKVHFQTLTDSLKKVAQRADKISCVNIIQEWLNFFKDQHVYVSLETDSLSSQIIRNHFAESPKISLSRQAFYKYLKVNKNKIDPIEGVWADIWGMYEIGIISGRKISQKYSNKFIGFILKSDSVFWMPEQIKLIIEKKNSKYKATKLYLRNHTERKSSIAFTPTSFVLDNGWGTYEKKMGKLTRADDKKKINLEDKYSPSFKEISKNISLLVMPSFDLNYKPIIDSILKRNDSVIRNTQHLIIDIRNNLGGTVLCFENLIPYLYTNPIVTKGASVLSTKDNIENYYGKYDYPNISDSMKKAFKLEGEILKKHIGEIYPLWPDDTLRFEKVYAMPQKISILINEQCASSAELFLLKARQSSKVKLVGKRTMGAVDYSNSIALAIPCVLYKIHYSSSLTNRYPAEIIDNIGIKPDINIDDDNIDLIKLVQEFK